MTLAYLIAKLKIVKTKFLPWGWCNCDGVDNAFSIRKPQFEYPRLIGPNNLSEGHDLNQ